MDRTDTKPGMGNKFHWLFLPGQRPTSAAYDTVLEETQHFAVLPTKGSIVPGWVLIVPKFPIPRMADIPANLHDELNELVLQVFRTLRLQFGTPYIFEHGGIKGSKVSCGVDQAHLHIACLDFDLVAAAESERPHFWQDVSSSMLPRSDLAESEYWFVSNGSTAKSKTVDLPCSQFFRKIIARETGKIEFWDYRSDDFIENVSTTIKALSANG